MLFLVILKYFKKYQFFKKGALMIITPFSVSIGSQGKFKYKVI